jgi:ankyrin repeat protein
LKNGTLSALQIMVNNVEPEIKASLAESYNEEGETPLIVAIQRKSLPLVKYLIHELNVDTFRTGKFAWNGVAGYVEAPPLFMAIIASDFYISKYLIEFQSNTFDGETVGLNAIISSSLGRVEKINVLELLGAAYIHHDLQHPRHNNQTTRRRGLVYWKEAMNLRLFPSSEGEPPIPKILPHYTSDSIAGKAMSFSIEITTSQQLEQLSNEPDIQLFTQAILVIQRIMSQLVRGPHSFTLYRLYTYAYEFYDSNQYSRVINILMLMLEPFRGQWSDSWDLNFAISGTLDIVNDSFRRLKRMPPDSQQRGLIEDFSFDNLMTAFDFAVAINRLAIRKRLTTAAQTRLDTSLYEVILNLTELMLPQLSLEESHRFKKALYHFLRENENHKFNHFDQGDILHAACRWPHISIDLIQLLLDLGADPNSISAKGNTPLHLLAMINCESWSTTITDAVQKLLDFGAHIDQSNRFGRTALNMLKNRQRQLSRQGFPDLKLGSLTNSRRVLPLSCLSAQVLRKNQIPFKDGEIPFTLHSFVRQH